LGIFSDSLDRLLISNGSVFYLSLESSIKVDFSFSEMFFELLILA